MNFSVMYFIFFLIKSSKNITFNKIEPGLNYLQLDGRNLRICLYDHKFCRQILLLKLPLIPLNRSYCLQCMHVHVSSIFHATFLGHRISIILIADYSFRI